MVVGLMISIAVLLLLFVGRIEGRNAKIVYQARRLLKKQPPCPRCLEERQHRPLEVFAEDKNYGWCVEHGGFAIGVEAGTPVQTKKGN